MYVQRKRWHILLFWNVITVSIKIVQLLLTDLFFPLYKKSWSWDSFEISLNSWRMCIMKSQVIFWGDETYFESPVHFVFSAPDSNWRIINMILFFFLHVVHTHCTTWQYMPFNICLSYEADIVSALWDIQLECEKQLLVPLCKYKIQ